MHYVFGLSTHGWVTSVNKTLILVLPISMDYNKKQFWSVHNKEKGFHSQSVFVLDARHWAISMFVSHRTNVPPVQFTICLSKGYFFRAAEDIFTRQNIEDCFKKMLVSTSSLMYQWAFEVLKLALSLKSFDYGIWIGLKYYKKKLQLFQTKLML